MICPTCKDSEIPGWVRFDGQFVPCSECSGSRISYCCEQWYTDELVQETIRRFEDTVIRPEDRDAFMRAFDDTEPNQDLVDLMTMHRMLKARRQKNWPRLSLDMSHTNEKPE